MKKSAIFGLLVVLLTFGFISCDNGNGNNNGNIDPENNSDIFVYNLDNTKYNGTGVITAINGSNNAINHGNVGVINNGIINFNLPTSFPDNQLTGGTIKTTNFILSHDSKVLYLADLSNSKITYFIYATLSGNIQNGSDTLTVTQGWNIFEATFSNNGGPPLIGSKISTNLNSVYDLGYKWILVSQN